MQYYSEKLSADKLQICYDLAPPRVKQYLEAEINHVLEKINTEDEVLELGCGYGRILPAIANKAKSVTGIDTSAESIAYGKKFLGSTPNCEMIQMNALNMLFKNNIYDIVVCIQNGISAFHVDRKALIKESIRVVKPGGIVLFSSYSEKFWDDRLEWFRLQAEAGLIGEIDYEKTGAGKIICKDGFTASTVSADQFIDLASGLNADIKVEEVNNSSIFFELVKYKPRK